MEEVFVGRDRRVVRSVTALGGATLALVVGMAIGIPMHYHAQSALRAELSQSHKAESDQQAKTIETLRSEIVTLKANVPCEGVREFIVNQQHSAQRIMSMVNEFPAFKTEPFKSLYARLADEAQTQYNDLVTLERVTKAEDLPPTTLCGRGTISATSQPVWQRKGIALTPSGWVGQP